MREQHSEKASDAAGNGRTRRVLKKLGGALVYLIFLLASASAILYVLLFLPRVRALSGKQRPATETIETHGVLDLQTAKRLGHVSVDKKSHFVHFPFDKRPGVERICAFGDSYTRGSETGPTHDFPSLLQRLLDRRAPDAFEVLNFGSAWHGFHQAFIAWESLAPRYACDTILLGPTTFFPQRDTRFNHSQLHAPYFLHARYILEGDDVRLVDVLGDTHSERFDHYFRFLPHMRYLRFDRDPPFVIKALIPDNRTVKNFAYYRSDSETQEAFATYSLLLSKMARTGSPIILVNYDPDIVSIARDVGSRNLRAVALQQTHRFPYGAPRGHNSAWGNALLAEQLAALVRNEDLPELAFLESRSLQEPVASSADSAIEAQPVSSFESIAVALGDREIGHLYSTGKLFVRGKGGPKAFHQTDTVSLLAFKSPGLSTMDACFVPLRRALADGMRVELRTGSERLELGAVRLLSPGLGVGVVDVPKLDFFRFASLRFPGNPTIPWKFLERSEQWTVAVDGEPVLRGRIERRFLALRPLRGLLYRLRVGRGAYVPLSRLPEAGTYDLVLQGQAERPIRVPIATWHKTLEAARASLPP